MTYLTPEANELEKKAGELARLESLLSQKELELTTLKTELSIFERKYLQIVGVRLATLDELEAQIAAILLQENPNDELMREQANQARSQAENSAQAAKSYIKHDIVIPEFAPTDELKSFIVKLLSKCIQILLRVKAIVNLEIGLCLR